MMQFARSGGSAFRSTYLSLTITAVLPCLFLTLIPIAGLAQDDVAGTLQLAPLVVTASGFEQSVRDAPASITVITHQDLQEKRFNSIAEALDDVEGVDVGSSVGKTGGREVRMRGMPSDYTLILIDGRRQNVAGNVTPNGFGATQTSFMPPVNAIERIEVIRGPMSTLYGSDAMGGVINIITKKVTEQWAGSLTLENTFNEDSDFGNSQGASAVVSGPLVQDYLGLQLRGRKFNRAESDLQYLDASGDEIDVSKRGPSPVEADNYSLGGRLTLTPTENHDVWLDAETSKQKYDNSEGQLGTLGAGAYGPELRFEREQATLAHTGRFALGTLDSSLMHSNTETFGRTIPPGTPGEVAGSARSLETENLVFDTKLVAPISDHIVSIGGQWWEASMEDGVAVEEFDQTTWALFVEDEWLLRDNLALTLGARYDDHDAFGGQVSPRAYLVWNTTDRLTLKGGVSRGYKTPRLDQLADGIVGFTGQGTIPIIGSPGLEPEKSTSSEIGFIYETPRGISAGATIFHNEFTDKITAGPDLPNCSFEEEPGRPGCVDYGNWPEVAVYSQSINIDEAITQGVELSLRVPLIPDWSVSANYTYTDSEQKTGPDEGEPLTDTPEHAVNASLRWRTTDRLTTWLRGEYNSERYRARERIRGAPSFADLGDFKAYSLFHLGGSYRVSDNVTLNAAIYNLLDKDFVDYESYSADGELSYGNVYANSEEGRRYWLSANLEF